MNQYHVLPTSRIDPDVELAQAEPWTHEPVTTNSPALAVMTDLTQVKAATIRPSMLMSQAEQSMIYQSVRLLFVVSDKPGIVGLITSNDIYGQKPILAMQTRNLRHDELTVADVMTGLDAINAIAYERLQRATVGDAIATLKRFGRNHLLIVEQARGNTPRRIRGLVSRSQIEHQLGEPVTLAPVANSFAEIERALL